jgi:circadian clock protein KaiC
MDVVIDPRLSTGVAGLDELLQGGLTPNRMYLIEGKPGTGKTTIAMQFLLAGRDHGETGLYVALSETENELRAIAASHGWDLHGIELFQLPQAGNADGQSQYTLYHPAEVELGETVQALLGVVERLRPKRIVLDSLSELKLLARDPLRYRRQILALKSFFAGRDCTVLLLDDLTDDDSQLQSLSHGVILLDQLPIEYGRARRRVRVVKLRGIPATEGFHDFAIRRGGVIVFPQIPVPTPEPLVPDPVRSGIEELDTLVGGGLTLGTTTLVIGPSGSGKSTLAMQYIAANDPAPAAVFLFDERLRTYAQRGDALGMRISERLASGLLHVHQIEPGELSPGEFSTRVHDEVERQGARTVLIDSINGYLHAIPQSDAPLARMHELLSYLNERGVSTLIVLAQHGIVGTAMTTPLDVSYLADTVLVLRFFEAQGRVRRAISVVKMRTRVHEQTIRELQLGPGRLHIGGALTEFEGVLTGVPRYVGGDRALLHHDKTK